MENRNEINLLEVYTDPHNDLRPMYYLCPSCGKVTIALKEPNDGSRCEHCETKLSSLVNKNGQRQLIGYYLIGIGAGVLLAHFSRPISDNAGIILSLIAAILTITLHFVLPRIWVRILIRTIGGTRFTTTPQTIFAGLSLPTFSIIVGLLFFVTSHIISK